MSEISNSVSLFRGTNRSGSLDRKVDEDKAIQQCDEVDPMGLQSSEQSNSGAWAGKPTESESMGTRTDLANKSGRSGEWQEVSNEGGLYKGRDELLQPRNQSEGISTKVDTEMQCGTALRELKDANEKQSRALTEERVRNSELTRTVESQLGEPRPSKPPPNDRLLEEQNRKLTKEVESLREELATVRSQSLVPSQSKSEATECKKLTMEAVSLQNELKRQRDRATELEVKLRSVSLASQACTLCEVFRSQLEAKDNAIIEKDSKLALLTTRLQKLEVVAANTAGIVSESKQMAAQKNGLEERVRILQREKSELERTCREMKEQLENARRSIDEMSRRQSVGYEMEDLRRNVTVLTNRNADLTKRNADFINMITDLEGQIELARNDKSKELQDKLSAYEAQLKTYEDDFKQERKDRESLHVKYSDLEETFRARESKLLADLQEKEKAYADLKWRYPRPDVEQRYTETEQRYTDLERRFTVMQEHLEASQAEVQTKNQQVKQYKTQVDRCKEQITTLEVLLQQSGQPDGGYRGGYDGGYYQF